MLKRIIFFYNVLLIISRNSEDDTAPAHHRGIYFPIIRAREKIMTYIVYTILIMLSKQIIRQILRYFTPSSHNPRKYIPHTSSQSGSGTSCPLFP